MPTHQTDIIWRCTMMLYTHITCLYILLHFRQRFSLISIDFQRFPLRNHTILEFPKFQNFQNLKNQKISEVDGRRKKEYNVNLFPVKDCARSKSLLGVFWTCYSCCKTLFHGFPILLRRLISISFGRMVKWFKSYV